MNEISSEIEQIFCKIYFEKAFLQDFEKWIYESTELEEELNLNSYYEFISFNYKQEDAYLKLKKLIEKEISTGQIEKWKITKDLLNAKNKINDYPKSIRNFALMYFEGYKFLDCLTFPYGLHVDRTYMYFEVRTFEALPDNEKQKIILICYPSIINKIHKVLNWLETEEIILVGTTDRHGKLEYIDNRIEIEEDNLSVKVEKVENRKWWEFWK